MRSLYLIGMLLVPIAALAQLSTVTVSGDVEDMSGGRIPATTIKLLNLQTGSENVAISDGSGNFLLSSVLPGTYSMQVAHDGFAAIHFFDLSLHIGESRQFRIRLHLGTVEERVDVDASGQNLSTDDVQMDSVVNARLVENLPLNGRSFQDLIAMTPGALVASPQIPRTGGFSVNGQQVDTNVYLIDGISGNYGSGPLDTAIKVPATGQYASVTSIGTTHGLVALEALQEFRVVASTPTAEYGRATGGQFALLTQQGTSEIHGSSYAYLRNGYFDAADWFGGYTHGNPYSYFYQQDIGSALSMPLLFWKHSAGRDLTRVFGSYEELHVRQRTAPLVQYVPGLQLYAHAAPQLRAALSAFPTPYSFSQMPGLGLVPYPYVLPEVTGSPPSYLRTMDFRIDRTMSSKFSGFARFGNTPSGSDSSLLQTTTHVALRNQIVAAGLDAQMSAHTGNEMRFGWARTWSSTASRLEPSLDLASILGSSGPSRESRSEIYLRFAGTGETSALTDGGRNGLQHIQLRDTFSLQRGAHLVRMGFDLRSVHSFVEPLPWSIAASYLSPATVLGNRASMLVLRRSTPAQPMFHQISSFVQDTWNLSHHVTLSTGLRWDLNPPPTGADGHDAFHLEGDLSQPQSLAVAPQSSKLWQTDRLELGPRIGAAWQPVQDKQRELVVRTGVGIVFDDANRAAAPSFTTLGFSNTRLLTDAPLPSPISVPDSTDLSQVPYNARLGYLFPKHLASPFSLQWNLSVERALGIHQSLAVSYVAASGQRLLLPQRTDLAGKNTAVREVVSFSGHESSRFDSFQARYQGRISSELTWIASYVLSHTFDFASVYPWGKPTYASSDVDVRHNLQVAVTWTAPRIGGSTVKRNALNGWGIDGRFFARSAYPVTPLGHVVFDPVTGERFYTGADLIVGRPLYQSDNTTPGNRRLNGGPSLPNGAFQLPNGSGIGTAPRNIARGFGAQQLSLSLRREIPLYDRVRLELRADAFNITNIPDFGYIDPYVSDALFGQPTLSLNQSYGQTGSLYQPGGPRSLQWMFRIRW
jgi:hypothetical protein